MNFRLFFFDISPPRCVPRSAARLGHCLTTSLPSKVRFALNHYTIDRSDRNGASFGERFSGAESSEIEENVEAIACRDFLETMFEQYLTERERKILYLYYGLDDGEPRTLEVIGSLLGVTRERIRQIRNRAFEKLLESPHGESLSGLWNAN